MLEKIHSRLHSANTWPTSFLSLQRILTNFLYSGYDFGYFVKLLTAVSLPTTEESFFDVLRIWFPTVYDLKFMMRACKQLKGGLQEVADDLGVSKILVSYLRPNPHHYGR
jgi:hypothetical protein